jgi:YHS domain-containing protein
MPVESGGARALEYDGRSYAFCSRTCEDEFARGPERFLRARPFRTLQQMIGMSAKNRAR